MKAVWTKHSDTEYGFGNYYVQKEGKQWIVSFYGAELLHTTNLKDAKTAVKNHSEGNSPKCSYCGEYATISPLRPCSFAKGEFICQSSQACYDRQQPTEETPLHEEIKRINVPYAFGGLNTSRECYDAYVQKHDAERNAPISYFPEEELEETNMIVTTEAEFAGFPIPANYSEEFDNAMHELCEETNMADAPCIYCGSIQDVNDMRFFPEGWACANGETCYSNMLKNEETIMADPRDTNNEEDCEDIPVKAYFADGIESPWGEIATDEEIRELAQEFDNETRHIPPMTNKLEYYSRQTEHLFPKAPNGWETAETYTPMSDEELSEAISVEILGERQQNTQIMVRVETLSGKQIPGIWPLEAWMQKGFKRDESVPPSLRQQFTLVRSWSETDADWLIAYHAQGGG